MLFSLAFTGILLTASAFDLKAFRIPNALPLALIALFLIKVAATADIAVWPGHLIAFGLTFAVLFLAFALGLVGGGDAKLMAAIALWFGLGALPSFLAITAIGGGVLALALLALRRVIDRRPARASAAVPVRGMHLLDRQAPVPYALPIAVAALWLEWRWI